MPVTWEEALENMRPSDRRTLEKTLGTYEEQELVTGMPPDIATNPLITGKSLLSLVKKGKRILKNIPRSIDEVKLETARYNHKIQTIWSPEEKKLIQIPTEKAQSILKEKGFSNLPMLNVDEKRVFNYGIMTPKTYKHPVTKKNVTENVQYGRIKALMGDYDIENDLHPSSSVSVKDAGEVYGLLERYVKNYPGSVVSAGMTPGGFRAWLIDNMTALKLGGPNAIKLKSKFLTETNSDINYVVNELARSAEGYTDYATNKGLLKNAIHRLQLNKPFKNYNEVKENPNKAVENFIKTRDNMFKDLHNPWHLKPSETSNIRYDIKDKRMLFMDGNKKYGAPFGYEELFTIGDPRNISVQQLDITRRAGQATKDLRAMRGVTDPDRPEFGAGFLESLEKQLPTLPNKVQADIRAKLLLGLTPFIMPTADDKLE